MSLNLLTEHHLEFLSLKGGCTGSSESTRVKMPHCKSDVAAQMYSNSLEKATITALFKGAWTGGGGGTYVTVT